jgi:LysR family transcriptional regulator for metE and metH
VDAAERLHLTQSALSHQFKELEERLGMPLFVRKTKPVRFTSAGLRLLQLTDAVLPLLRSAERDLARLAGGTAGRLHMAIECHSCFQWLMPTIDQFRDAWPEVELDLASGFSFAPLPALARGDLDLVVTSDPLELAGITYVPLFTYEAMLAVANQHPLASKPFIQPEDLATETLITYPVERDRLDIFTRFHAEVASRRQSVDQQCLATFTCHRVLLRGGALPPGAAWRDAGVAGQRLRCSHTPGPLPDS